MSASSPAKKSARKSAPGRPFQPGPDPRRGRGPAPGEGGRPPKTPLEIREALRLGTPDRIARLEELAESDDLRISLAATVYLIDRDLGKPTERVQLDAPPLNIYAPSLNLKVLALRVFHLTEGLSQEQRDRVTLLILGRPEALEGSDPQPVRVKHPEVAVLPEPQDKP